MQCDELLMSENNMRFEVKEKGEVLRPRPLSNKNKPTNF